MTKNFDEIDILQLMKTLWDEKIKIVLVTILSTVIAIAYIYFTPNVFISSIVIKAGKNSEFIKFQNISSFFSEEKKSLVLPGSTEDIKNPYLTINESNSFIITKETILESFMQEIMDYNELLDALTNYNKTKEKISDLSITKEHEELLYYVKSFSADRKNDSEYTLTFKWHDKKEIVEIIDQTLKSTLINFKNSFFKELEQHINEKKKKIILEDLKIINYLTEQSLIAKELNISENQLQNVNLFQNSNAYYLRGYKAIDKEIGLVQKRKYKDFTDLKKDIKILKEMNFDWVNYNIFMIDIYSEKNPLKILIISIFIGLLFGGIYVLISNSFEGQKVRKRKNN